MKFEWDESKRQTNIHKHRIDFVDVIPMFNDEAMTLEDLRFDYGENRFWLIGFLRNALIIVTYTLKDKHTTRIISARKATKHEQKRFIA